MNTTSLIRSDGRRRGGAAAGGLVASGAANGAASGAARGGGGQASPSSLSTATTATTISRGKQPAAATPSIFVPGLSSAPDWPERSASGFSPPKVQRLSSARDFWERCVVARQPGVLPASALDDDGTGETSPRTPSRLFAAPEKWTPEYLKKKAGHVRVDVESRRDALDRFGKGGTKQRMSFAEFVDRATATTTAATAGSKTSDKSSGSASSNDDKRGSLLYLTAQRPPRPALKDEGARPAPLGPLALALAEDFPVVPALARGLVLQSVNLWCGRTDDDGGDGGGGCGVASSSSTSSGLHHDFHDNLYAVVGGAKRFAVFPPAAAAEMRPAGGAPRLVHRNGRIVYRSQGDVGADGGDEGLVRMHEYRRWKAVMAADGVEVESDDEEDDEEDGTMTSSDDDGGGLGAADAVGSDDGDDDGDDEDDADLVAALAAAEKGAPVADDYEEEEEDDEDDDDDDDETDPPSFSTLDPREPAHAALLPTHRAAVVDIGPGDLLYLPCGWFHEVSSSSSSRKAAQPAAAAVCSPLHVAVNWWFHPPDRALCPDNPYSRPYWRELFVDAVESPRSKRLRELCERQGAIVDVDDDYGFNGKEEEEQQEVEKSKGKKKKKKSSSSSASAAAAAAAAVERLREGLDELDALMAGGDEDDDDENEEEMEEEDDDKLSKKKRKKKARA